MALKVSYFPIQAHSQVFSSGLPAEVAFLFAQDINNVGGAQKIIIIGFGFIKKSKIIIFLRRKTTWTFSSHFILDYLTLDIKSIQYIFLLLMYLQFLRSEH